MADSKARGPLSVNPPSQISKDISGSDNSIPLSPQWLLSKPGENKTGMAAVENHSIPYSGSNSRSDARKFSGSGNEITKKKDVFRPSVLDPESDRRERWRDEERVRDTGSSIRKDRWREGDKEPGDVKKMDRWADTTAGVAKNFGEARRPASERWADPPKEAGFDQRRESKWNTRWGPDSKEIDKRKDYGKQGDVSIDKTLPYLVPHAKEDRDGDQQRPWRSSSGRGRADPLQNQFQAGGRDSHLLGYGRGRDSDGSLTFLPSRGKLGHGASTIKPHVPGFSSERDDYKRGESSPFKYPRKIFLDAYRNVDVRMSRMLLNGFEQIPSLTQEEALEPFSLSAPTSEELDILNDIEKGNITSSGAPQISKEGSAGRPSADQQPRRTRFGSREGASFLDEFPSDNAEGFKGVTSNIPVGSPNDKQMLAYGSDHLNNFHDQRSSEVSRGEGGSSRKFEDINRDSASKGNAVFQSRTAWQSSIGVPSDVLAHDHFDAPTDVNVKSSDVSWPQSRKDHTSQWEQGLPNPYLVQNDQKRPVGENPVLKRQQSGVMDHDLDSRKFPQISPSPEDLILYYRDPQGAIQGPFSGSDIIGWFEAGYFGIDLPVRVANAPPHFPFAGLGDVMPHLKSKRPPPGFNAPKVSDMPEISRPALGNQGKFLASSSGIDLLRDEHRQLQGSSSDAANRFLESLMGTNSSFVDRFPSSEGLQGYAGHGTGGPPPTGTGSFDTLDFLAKRLADQSRSVSSAHPHWPARDGSMAGSIPQMHQDPPTSQTMVSPPLPDLPSQPLHPQNVDMMSVIQGLSDRSSSSINNGIGGWSNFPTQGSGQNLPPQAAFLLHQQSMAAQNHPSLPNLLGQGMDNQASMITAEKFFSSALSQDPQVLNLLQQQYLLQMQAQAPSAAQQLSLVDRILLLKQQQKQEEQLRQQQQLLSQVLTEQHQRAAESSFGQLQAASIAASTATTSAGNVADQFLQRMSHQMLLAGQQVPMSSAQGAPNLGSMPHQLFDTQHPNFPGMPVEDVSAQLKNTLLESKLVQSSTASTAVENVKDDCSTPLIGLPSNSRNEPFMSTTAADFIAHSLPSQISEASHQILSERPLNNETFVPEQAEDAKDLSVAQPQEHNVKDDLYGNEDFNREEPKHAEVREVKKSSEKKSRKQKASKVHPPSSDQLSKGTTKSSQGQKQHESEIPSKSEVSASPLEVVSLSKDVPKMAELVGNQNVSGSLAQRAWKAPASVKPKSLVEIQQEEQKRAQTEAAAPAISSSLSTNTKSLSSPWSGVVSSSDPKIFTMPHQGSNKNVNVEETESSKSKRSQLHDLLAAEVLAKANEEVEASDTFYGQPSLPLSSSQPETIDDDNFIEAKDTKRSRKKGAKGKGSGNKSSPAISLNEVAVAPSSIDKVKNTRQTQPEKEVLPAPPQGPSLSDFVPWKGVESTSPSPAPAWFTESGKVPQAISLRDILKEQGKRGGVSSQQVSAPPLPAPQKSQPTQVSRQNSWSLSGSSPSKMASPTQSRAQATPQSSKYKGDDDLFWGPPELSNPENKQPDFPQLGNHGGSSAKNNPVKGSSSGVALTRQKSAAAKATVVTSSPASAKSLTKGKRDGDTKHSEAMDFRNWCESESIRLTGSRDTSFLEFCVKQPKSEAEILLTQNMGSLDPNHEFIGRFLDYMEMLPSDVLAIAFQGQKDRKITSYGGGREMNSDMSMGDSDIIGAGAAGDGSAKGGKKKGKKGKKVSAAVLGFNVVSNRIMMGEIQTVED